MPTEVILPRVDMDMTEGRISRWYVCEGAKVEKGQPIFEIETDNAAMEVEAPASGVIRGLSTALDTPLPVGSTVAWIDLEEEGTARGASSPSTSSPASAMYAAFRGAAGGGAVAAGAHAFGTVMPPTPWGTAASAPSHPAA